MNNRGFTLIELIITIALLSIIAVISFVSINNVIEDSKINDCNTLVNNIKSAVMEYVSDNRYNEDAFSYCSFTDPNAICNVTILGSDLTSLKYLSSPIVNPFDNDEIITPDSITIEVNLKNDYTISNDDDSIRVRNSLGNVVDCDNKEW